MLNLRLLRDDRGVSALEFALIAPIMILFYLGMAELTGGMLAERRASHAASAVGDLVAQSQVVTPADVTDIFEIADSVVKPSPTTNLRTCLVSIRADGSGSPKALWVRTNRSPSGCPVEGATVPGVPTNLITANQGLVMAQVEYTYVSSITNFLPSPITFKERFYLRPRQSEYVALKTS